MKLLPEVLVILVSLFLSLFLRERGIREGKKAKYEGMKGERKTNNTNLTLYMLKISRHLFLIELEDPTATHATLEKHLLLIVLESQAPCFCCHSRSYVTVREVFCNWPSWSHSEHHCSRAYIAIP